MKLYKKDQRGITHNIMLVGVALLVLGAVGFAGYRVYKSKNDISAKAATWSQSPGTDRAVSKANGPVLTGSFAEKETNVSTLANKDSPIYRYGYAEYGNTDIGGYDYQNGDLYYVHRVYSGSSITSFDIKKAPRAGGSVSLLKSIPGGDYYNVQMCVGANYIAYFMATPTTVSVYAATKDLTQSRLVMNESQVRTAGGDGSIRDISCGDQYFYTISSKKILKSPYNNQRVGDSSGSKRIDRKKIITLPDVTAVYDVLDYNYGFCGKQYQTDNRIAILNNQGVSIINLVSGSKTTKNTTPQNTTTVKNIPASALNQNFNFCTLSPDGKYLANGKNVGVYDIDNSVKLKDIRQSPSNDAFFTYGWSPIL